MGGWTEIWVGAPADRRQAFHDHSLRGGHPALLKHGRHPHGGMDLERVGWRGAAIARRCPARGAAGFAQRLVGARLRGKIRGRGWVAGRCHPHGWLDLARVAGRCHRRGGCLARGVVGFAPAPLWGRAFSGTPHGYVAFPTFGWSSSGREQVAERQRSQAASAESCGDHESLYRQSSSGRRSGWAAGWAEPELLWRGTAARRPSSSNRWAAGDWVGAPEDRRPAVHGRRLRGCHPALQDGGSDCEEAERREAGAGCGAPRAESSCGAES